MNLKVIVKNSPAVPQEEGTVREVGAAPGSFVYISKALAGRGGEALPPHLTGGKLG